MANRYLRATGNWNGPVWAATESGTAGSAATPTADDWVYIAANYTVTLTADAVCNLLTHTNGTVSLGSSKLTVNGGLLKSNGSTARTFNLGNGTLHIKSTVFGNISFAGSNLTIIPGSSLVIIDYDYAGSPFDTLSKTFNDVVVNMPGWNDSLAITGSPTFRSLTIQSKNSAAHTVNFESLSTVTADKFIAIGSSSSNKLTLKSSGAGLAQLIMPEKTGTMYGQYVQVGISGDDDSRFVFNPTPDSESASGYIGSESVIYGTNPGHWVAQDPPKISTLVDPLTTAPGSNPNWTVHPMAEAYASMLGMTPVKATPYEGAYIIGASPDEVSFGGMMSTDTYDFTNSTFIMEVLGADGATSGRITIVLDATESSELQRLEWENNFASVSGEPDDIIAYSLRGVTYSVSNTLTHTSGPRWVKIRMDDDTLYTSISFDGLTFTTEKSLALPDDAIYLLKSARVSLVNLYTAAIGSINPTLVPPNNANFLAFFYP